MEKERISAPAAVLIAENPQVLNQFIRTELNVPDDADEEEQGDG